jgi:biopolymer transport protein ExbD
MDRVVLQRVDSPYLAEPTTTAAILDGLETGLIDVEDRVAIGDEKPLALQDHPRFAAAIAQWQDAQRKPPEDETKLDMNPLIDVALVLLIFFILTTTYSELRKEITPPVSSKEKAEAKTTVTKKELMEFTIRVAARKDGERYRLFVENELTTREDLQKKLEDWVKKTGKSRVAIEIEPGVAFDALVQIQDAASGAGIQELVRISKSKK